MFDNSAGYPVRVVPPGTCGKCDGPARSEPGWIAVCSACDPTTPAPRTQEAYRLVLFVIGRWADRPPTMIEAHRARMAR